MEDRNTQELILDSKVFKIPIEQFNEELNMEPVKEKKKEILDLFTNYNKLHTKKEFDEIENQIHKACMEGDIELIKIYLSDTIENNSKSFIFKIDEANHTASLFKVNNYDREVIIPRTIEHDSKEYLITSICGTCEYIKRLKFEENSSVRTIHSFAFPYRSEIEEIYFPSSLKELKKGWCRKSKKLKKIIISPSNGQFKFIDDKYLIGKSDSNNDEFDTLLFASRYIEEISIPSNIKIISSFAFFDCKNLTRVEIPPNSNLQAIESYAFSFSDIKEIFIPPKVSKICENTFTGCLYLTKVEIPPNSNLQTIETSAFYNTKIKEIYFPSNLKELKKGWCNSTSELTKIIVSPSNGQFKFIDDKYLIGKSDPNKDEFDTLLFASRYIEEISIPLNIKIIGSYSFFDCNHLTRVEIPPNSNLQTIDEFAFFYSKIKSIFIPSKVSKICESAFTGCNTKIIEISEESKLDSRSLKAFTQNCYNSLLMIPSTLKLI